MEKDPRTDTFFTGRILLEETATHSTWITFDRKQDYQRSNSDAILVTYHNGADSSATLLGTFFGNRWSSPNLKNADLLWKSLKKHPTATKRILNKLKTPAADFAPITLEWKCLRRRFKLQSIKLVRSIR